MVREMTAEARERQRARKSAWHAAHLEEQHARNKAYREAHREELQAKRRAYHAAHREAQNAQSQRYRETHREKYLAIKRAYREAHREEERAKHRAYRLAHREEILRRKRAYYAAHREEILAKERDSRRVRHLGPRGAAALVSARAYHAKHREAILAKMRVYYATHREEAKARRRRNYIKARAARLAYARIYRATHLSDVLASCHRWRMANPDVNREHAKRRRARKARSALNDLTPAQWGEIQAAYDHRCVYCHKRHKGKLTQDHITPLSRGGNHTYSNIVPACLGCNMRKHAGPPLKPVQPLLLTIAPAQSKTGAAQ